MKFYNHFHAPFVGSLGKKEYLMACLDGHWYAVYANGKTNYHYKADYSENVARGIWKETELPTNFAAPNFK